jgi:DNA-binding helix-hairpin-helix protein with protein kinase domain
LLANPEISLEYSLTFRDFATANKLGVRQHFFIFLIHIIARYVATTLAFLLFSLIIITFFHGPRATIPSMLPLPFLLLLMPAAIWIGWWTSYKRYKQKPSVDPQMRFQADRTSFVREVQGMGELTWLWAATHGIVKNKKVVLVVARKGAFVIIPRRAISDEQIALLEEMWQQGRLAA